ncbi:MAG: SCO1/SenC family protein [uncultured Sulfurovum sp.]|uniref:SCO1/SenC family protein n=1 Tax=uncultured Sulfurovum sp. TaxID=269237 RepID=A0A6S6SB92_9BACT|nr:MAG: SCO1/SenC family protein [uncultured Sulfurovum sp.]
MKKYLFLLLLTLPLFSEKGAGIGQKLGDTVPLDLTFINEQAKEVTLRELMDGKPTLLTLNYYRCAGVCSPQLEELAATLSKVQLAENLDYKVITVGFAEDEDISLAITKKKNIISSMTRHYVQDAWQFVLGENNSSGKLAQSVGFKYKAMKMENGDLGYIHGASVVMISPEGKITRYLNGINQLPADITMAIKEASEGKVRQSIPRNNSPFCFTERPEAGLMVNNITRMAGVLSVIALLVLFFFFLRRGRKK